MTSVNRIHAIGVIKAAELQLWLANCAIDTRARFQDIVIQLAQAFHIRRDSAGLHNTLLRTSDHGFAALY